MSGWKLAPRLALWFALVSALVLSATGAYLYRSLERQLVERDDAELIGKVAQVRFKLREVTRGEDGVRAEAAALVHHVFGLSGVILELRSARGELLVASHPGLDLPVPTVALAADERASAASVREWKEGRLIAAWAAVGAQAQPQVMIILAGEGSRRAALLASYTQDVIQAAVAGALIMALLGYAVARSALRPVCAIARTAGGITANRLGERLRLSDAPAELAELVQAFNAMLERLDESFRRLAQFSSDIAHDLRTPIHNLMSGAQVALSARRTAEEYETLLASQVEEYERINRMIDAMLFLARADNAQMALDARQLEARAELARVAEYFAGPAEEAGVGIQVEGEGTLEADPALFRRAVGNLVQNALCFTPRGGTVSLRAFNPGDGRCVVEVSNPGPGIPAQHLPHIFERFYRADSARCDSQSSSGLGLAIVKSIVTLHGGRVEVESSPGRLTSFRLDFPPAAAGAAVAHN